MNKGGRFRRSKAEERKMDPPTPVVPTRPEIKQPKANEPHLMFLISISKNGYFSRILEK
jgi:hypothetical protein